MYDQYVRICKAFTLFTPRTTKYMFKTMTVYRFQNFDLAIRKRFSVNKRLKKTEVAANKDNLEIITKKTYKTVV